MTIEQIKIHLFHGDYKKIAQSVGTSSDYVHMVLRGARNTKKGKGKMIYEKAQELAHFNQSFININ
jgi:hypothetical protein